MRTAAIVATMEATTAAAGRSPSADVHGIGLPDGRIISAAESNSPRIFKNADAWASAMTESIAARAWHEAGVPHAGEA